MKQRTRKRILQPRLWRCRSITFRFTEKHPVGFGSSIETWLNGLVDITNQIVK